MVIKSAEFDIKELEKIQKIADDHYDGNFSQALRYIVKKHEEESN